MDIQLLLKKSETELAGIITELEQEIIAKKKLLNPISRTQPDLVDTTSLIEEINCLKDELALIKILVLYKKHKSRSATEPENCTDTLNEEITEALSNYTLFNSLTIATEENTQLKSANDNLEKTIDSLLNRTKKHKLLEGKFKEYLKTAKHRQQSLSMSNEQQLNKQLVTIRKLHELYASSSPCTSNLQSLLGKICHHDLSSNYKKSTIRSQQINRLENLATILLTNTVDHLQADNLDALLLTVSMKIGIGFTDSSPDPVNELELSLIEKQNLLNVTKYLILYGYLNDTAQQIATETNLAPSRLAHIIQPLTQQIIFETYKLSEGLITPALIDNIAKQAFTEFNSILQQSKEIDSKTKSNLCL